jgi:c-di-GMP-binding flagellar brake protein YcgR
MVEVKASNGFAFSTQAVNISLGGIGLIEVPMEAQTCPKLDVRFPLPGTQTTISAEAEIRWCTRDGRAGLQFLHLEDKSSTELKRWILQMQLQEGWESLK